MRRALIQTTTYAREAGTWPYTKAQSTTMSRKSVWETSTCKQQEKSEFKLSLVLATGGKMPAVHTGGGGLPHHPQGGRGGGGQHGTHPLPGGDYTPCFVPFRQTMQP